MDGGAEETTKSDRRARSCANARRRTQSGCSLLDCKGTKMSRNWIAPRRRSASSVAKGCRRLASRSGNSGHGAWSGGMQHQPCAWKISSTSSGNGPTEAAKSTGSACKAMHELSVNRRPVTGDWGTSGSEETGRRRPGRTK